MDFTAVLDLLKSLRKSFEDEAKAIEDPVIVYRLRWILTGLDIAVYNLQRINGVKLGESR